ncbi:Crp/Fnr family transcriptional regulator [Parvularcula sp. IMCC14364]|uniref:Crp/Fnr family transcriptional regulator n=1 Tax=Parvularcula sp. IMCC14364 TaxID=3067902 RepID=UPI0027404BE1|nr:cyclic nucleotide-binding domain-containing protein [Parvularcula sp. IMCC14364]
MNLPLRPRDAKEGTRVSRSLGCALCSVRERSVCTAMHQKDLPEVEQRMARRHAQAGTALMTEGEPNETLFVLVKGSIRLSKQLEDGRRQVTGFLFPGDMLGMRKTQTAAYTAETLEDSYLCRFTHGFLDQAAERAPAVSDRLLHRAQHEYHRAQEHIVLLGKRIAIERVQYFIEIVDRAIGHDDPARGRLVPLPMPRQDIADYLGLRLETLSRTLGQLRKQGHLLLVNKHFLLRAETGNAPLI